MIQNRCTKYWWRLPYRKSPKPTIWRYLRCYLRYFRQNDMAETYFNASLYLISLGYNAKIRLRFLCITSSLQLMWYYVKMIFFQCYISEWGVWGWGGGRLCLTANNLQSIKARENFCSFGKGIKILIKKYNLKVTEAKYNLWKWTILVKILISKGYIRKCNMRKAM